MFASLRDVTGTLELFLNEVEISRATLFTDLFFKVDQIEGDIRPWIVHSSQPISTKAGYSAVFGHWPDPR